MRFIFFYHSCFSGIVCGPILLLWTYFRGDLGLTMNFPYLHSVGFQVGLSVCAYELALVCLLASICGLSSFLLLLSFFLIIFCLLDIEHKAKHKVAKDSASSLCLHC